MKTRAVVKTVVQHRVRYHEADAQGFLFNSRYLELADVAMTEYFRSLGFPYPALVAAGADPSVVSATLRFARPAHFDDVLDIGVACTRVGRSSFDLSMAISRSGLTIAEIDLTYVNVDAMDAVSRGLPDSVADALRADSAVGEHGALEIHQ
jgi:acyl-CoA thioester hydrolase